MARAKKIKAKNSKPSKIALLAEKKELETPSFRDQLKLSESYTSLLLGAAVVLGVAVLFFISFRSDSSELKVPTDSPLDSAITSPAPSGTYTLAEGETLWDVAVKFYGDGFRWVDIAKANNLEATADFVPPGTKLIIPK